MTLSPSRSQMAPVRASGLETLRVEIDRIDEALHGLLMERGAIIDQLIAVKARQGGGSAFRPAREAEMMRRLVARHAGILPLDTVESIWRIIISTFTYVQAPYTVHADISGGDPAMRDSCRFHFGFTVPLATHAGAVSVIDAVAQAAGDLGLVEAAPGAASPWWEALVAPEAPKIIARLPFVERADHAAGLPLLVVAKPLAEAAAGSEVRLYACETHRPQKLGALQTRGFDVIMTAPGDHKLIVAAAGAASLEDVAAAFAGQTSLSSLAWIGSHARRFELNAELDLAAS